MIEIEIPLPPVSWAAAIKGKHCFYDPKEKDKRAVRYYIAEQFEGPLLDDYFVIFLKYVFRMPFSATKKKKAEMLAGRIRPTRSDCTNLQKLYEDCLKGIVIKDDRYVAKIISEKIYGEKDSVNIKIFGLEEYENTCKSLSMKLTESSTAT